MSNDQFTWQSPFILQGMRRLFLAHQSDQSKTHMSLAEAAGEEKARG
jgi:hypothetical protein